MANYKEVCGTCRSQKEHDSSTLTVNISRDQVLSSFRIEDLENKITAESIADRLEAIDNKRKIEQCKDCEYVLHPEDHRERMDNGAILCAACTNESDRLANADWHEKESIRRN